MSNKYRVQDSNLAFYINQLTNLDKRLYAPLSSVTWGRDIKLREGITFSNESTSFMRSQYAAAGSLANASTTSSAGGSNLSFIGAESNSIPGVSVNGELVTTPLRLAARQVSYTSIELERSQLTGMPIDAQKMDALNTVYQMGIDQMVYVGFTQGGVSAKGLLNSSAVTASTVANGVSGSPLWINKTPDEILSDINTTLAATQQASGFARFPNKLIMPWDSLGYLSTTRIGTAGNMSILKYVLENNVSTTIQGQQLEIVGCKWATGQGAGSTRRMVAYTNEEQFVRFPMVPIRREMAYYQGMSYIAPYSWALGEVEFVYPETVRYADGF